MSKYTLKDAPANKGMNDLDHPTNLGDGECELLVNAYPGNPLRMREGIVAVNNLVPKEKSLLLPGTSFKPTIGNNQNLSLYYWMLQDGLSLGHGDTNDLNYSLLRIPVVSGGAGWVDGDPEVDNTGILCKARFAGTHFKFLKFNNYLYCISDATYAAFLRAGKTYDGWLTSYPKGNKVIEEDGKTIRDMCISAQMQWPYFVPSFTTEDEGLTLNKHYVYHFAYVRRDDLAAYIEGKGVNEISSKVILPAKISNLVDYDLLTVTYRPKTTTVFNPGVAESISFENDTVIISVLTMETPADSHIEGMTFSPFHESVSSTQYDEAIAQGATHLRIYRTLGQSTMVEAKGASAYFICDLALDNALSSYYDNRADASLELETNQLMKGYTDAPQGMFAEYAKNRLWVSGVPSTPGYVFYSETPGGDGFTDIEYAMLYPQKYANMFKPAQYMIDCDHNDGIADSGIVQLGDDIYFFKASKIFVLYSSDPNINTVTRLSATLGCPYPLTITVCELNGLSGSNILFMSNKGPARISMGGKLELLTNFKIKELWPQYKDSIHAALFFDRSDYVIGELEQLNWTITAEFFNSTWWLFGVPVKSLGGTVIKEPIGYYIDPNVSIDSNAPQGAFKFETSLPGYTPQLIVHNTDIAYMLRYTSEFREEGEYNGEVPTPEGIYNIYTVFDFLRNITVRTEKTHFDFDGKDGYRESGSPYEFRMLSKRIYGDSEKRITFEIFDALIHGDYADALKFDITLITDAFRYKQTISILGELFEGFEKSIVAVTGYVEPIVYDNPDDFVYRVFVRTDGLWDVTSNNPNVNVDPDALYLGYFYDSTLPNNGLYVKCKIMRPYFDEAMPMGRYLVSEDPMPATADRVRIVPISKLQHNFSIVPKEGLEGIFFQYLIEKEISYDGHFNLLSMMLHVLKHSNDNPNVLASNGSVVKGWNE